MKVSLQKIVDELEMRTMENTVFYNKITWETISVNDDDFRIVENDDFEKNLEKHPKWQKQHLLCYRMVQRKWVGIWIRY